MLRPELSNQDIPHCTTIRNRVLEVLDEYIVKLKSQLQVLYLMSYLMSLILSSESCWQDLSDY
jgi:hypothetical protein